VADYWAVARLFEEILENQQATATTNTFEWDSATQAIAKSSESIQEKYARTLAAFGVEVPFPHLISKLMLGVVMAGEQHTIIGTGSGGTQR
jgi:hypothetical protein